MLYQDRIAQLGWPRYKGQHQTHYLMELLIKGYSPDTRKCRFVGIGNLHSLLPQLERKLFPFTKAMRKTKDPVTGTTPSNEVLVVWMTAEQIQKWIERQNGEIQTLTNGIKKPKPRP